MIQVHLLWLHSFLRPLYFLDADSKCPASCCVQVVPVVARMLMEIFSGELSWSTDSIHLQISNPDVKDQTVEQFKVIQRLLQEQNIQGPWTPIVA